MRVLCVGLLVCDIVIKPVTKQTLEQDTSTADVIDITIGGDACNVARGLKQLGLDVSLMSIVGDDYWGKFILEQLSSSGLETKFIKCHTPPTSISAVLVSDSGNRSFVSLKGSCHQLQPDDISDEILKEHEILYVGSAGDLPGFEYEPLRKLLARAKVLGLKTIMDLTGEITSSFLDCIKNSFEYLDAFVPSIREVKGLFSKETAEDCLRCMSSFGVKNSCIKLGDKGSEVLEDGRPIIIKPFPAICIDSTGAGDAFVAGYIAGMASGFSNRECCLIGNYTGGCAVTQIGADAHLGNLNEILRNLELMEEIK